jgi:hypothetical protein
METITFLATRSAGAKDKLMRNLTISGGVFLVLWMAPRALGPEYIPPIFQNLFAAIAFITIFMQGLTLMYSRNPLTIYETHLVIAGFRKVRLELAHIEAIGTYKKDNAPCLEYNDEAKKHKGQIKLPWAMIAEPQDEVVAALKAALNARKTTVQ